MKQEYYNRKKYASDMDTFIVVSVLGAVMLVAGAVLFAIDAYNGTLRSLPTISYVLMSIVGIVLIALCIIGSVVSSSKRNHDKLQKDISGVIRENDDEWLDIIIALSEPDEIQKP